MLKTVLMVEFVIKMVDVFVQMDSMDMTVLFFQPLIKYKKTVIISITLRHIYSHFIFQPDIGCNAQNCLNGGFCDSNGKCICSTGYTGFDCSSVATTHVVI